MKANGGDRPVIRPLPAIDRARQVTDALADYVEEASLKAGDRLPAERELMAALAVGRSTIREAIRHFQALGVIETRKGSGTYLLKPVSKATIHMPLSLDTAHLRDVLLQTLEVRRGIECEAGMVAARRRTGRDLVLIEEKLDAMERVPAESRRIDISSSSTSEQFVQVTVTDQGTGLDGVDVERMFTLSYTTKDAGTGVGLSVSRSIVEAHGGKLWAEQNPGRGATFCFTIPAHSSVVVA